MEDIIHKTEMKMYNLNTVITNYVMLHHFCIRTNDPCNPRWKLSVEELELSMRNRNRQQNEQESNENVTMTTNWIW